MKKNKIFLRFWIKNLILKYYPNGYRYYREMQKSQDSSYVYARDRDPIRQKHNGKDGWKKTKKDELLYRNYDNYEEYMVHQKLKFEEMLKISGGFKNHTLLSYRLKFFRRFQYLLEYLPESAHILCAGARQGTEVEVLHDLNYSNAYGIDLNPGINNKLVQVGDFMHLENFDSSLDMIYSNCLDHAFDLDAFFQEHSRALKPNGYVLYDIALQKGGAFESVEWESPETVIILMLRHFKKIIKLDTEQQWKWVLLQGKR